MAHRISRVFSRDLLLHSLCKAVFPAKSHSLQVDMNLEAAGQPTVRGGVQQQTPTSSLPIQPPPSISLVFPKKWVAWLPPSCLWSALGLEPVPDGLAGYCGATLQPSEASAGLGPSSRQFAWKSQAVQAALSTLRPGPCACCPSGNLLQCPLCGLWGRGHSLGVGCTPWSPCASLLATGALQMVPCWLPAWPPPPLVLSPSHHCQHPV